MAIGYYKLQPYRFGLALDKCVDGGGGCEGLLREMNEHE